MSSKAPAHITAAGIIGRPIDYAWDEVNTRDDYWDRVSEPFRERRFPLSPRAELASRRASPTGWCGASRG